MKKLLLTLLVLAPMLAQAQAIYPLNVYASAKNAQNGQDIKFMTSPENVNYVGTCVRSPKENLCNLAKDGAYETTDGVKFHVKQSQLYSPDGKHRCGYSASSHELDC